MKMESTAKVYEVKLVLDVARFGDDPLSQNVSTLIHANNTGLPGKCIKSIIVNY